VHSNATAGHTHPVRERCADVFVLWPAVFTAVSTVHLTALVVGAAKDIRALVCDLFLHGENSRRGGFTGLPGADRCVDGDLALGGEELGTLLREIDAHFVTAGNSGIVNSGIFINGLGRAVVRAGAEFGVRSSDDAVFLYGFGDRILV